jgi:hypothetical protein
MDALQFNQELDRCLDATGLVDKSCFIQLADAYGHGGATSVGWVRAHGWFRKIRVPGLV